MADPHDEHLVAKLCEQVGVPDLDTTLGQAALRRIVPILTSAARQRARAKDGTALLREYEANSRFFGPSDIDQRRHITYAHAFATSLPDEFAMLELSPISPLGANSVLSRLSQDVTLTTIRGNEVVGDPTTALSIEAARRRRPLLVADETRAQPVHLATWHRVLRMQNFDAAKGYMQHFELFGLLSAGRDASERLFVNEAIAAHLTTWLRFIRALVDDAWTITDVRIAVSDTRLAEQLVRAAGADIDEVNRRAVDEDFDLFAFCGIELPKEVGVDADLDETLIDRYEARHHVAALRSLSRSLARDVESGFPGVDVTMDLGRKAGMGYYGGPCYHVYARNLEGRAVQLADGGEVDWLAQMLTSKKERCVSSGFGAELVQKLFMPR